MPGIKFSELAITTVIGGDEALPILQQGVNKTVTVDHLTEPVRDLITDNTVLINALSSAQTTATSNITNNALVIATNTTLMTTLDSRVSALSSQHISENINLTNSLTSLTSSHSADFNTLSAAIATANRDLESTLGPIFITGVDNSIGIIQTTYKPQTVPADLVIDAITVDDDSALTVTVEWDGPEDSWMGSASINNYNILQSEISQIGTSRRFTATVDIDATGETSLSATANGSFHAVPITLLGGGPEVLSVTFGPPPTTSGYTPAMYLDGDTVSVTATFNTSDVASISLYNGASTASTSVTDLSVSPTGNPVTATFNMTVDTSDSSINQLPLKITAKNSFGSEGPQFISTNTIPCRYGPEVTDVTFGTYPGTQTELKNNDTINITVEFDTNDITKIDFGGGNSYADNGEEMSATSSGLSVAKTMRIGTTRTTPQLQPVTVRARGSNSNYGAYFTSGDTLNVNNAYPTFSGYGVTYPTNQSAIKGTETAPVNLTVSNQGTSPTYTYTSPTGEINITDSAQYNITKQITGTSSGNYNISTSNYRLVVNRYENDATATHSDLVKISDTLPTLSVTYPGTRLRSGGNNNTTVQSYQIQVNSTQQLATFNMSPGANGGTLDGSWVSYSSGTIWRRNLRVSDDDDKGTFTWLTPTSTTLSNDVQSTLSTGSAYVLGGFVERTLDVPSQGWQVLANVEGTDYTKIQVNWSQKNLTTRATIGDISRPQTATWSLDQLSPAPITVNILDSGATNASSTPTTLTIEELE